VMPKNLIAAYLVTWAIHGAYLAWLAAKWMRVKK
jgi:hypothetical protein